MLIEMKTLSATPERTLHPGQKARVSEEEGRALVDGGWAVEIDGSGERVTPVRKPRRGRAATKASKAAAGAGDEQSDDAGDGGGDDAES